jgi:putative transposase
VVGELLLEPGIVVSYETIRCWVRKYGPQYARCLKRKPPSQTDIWYLDDVASGIAGKKHWLWQADDQDGCVLDENIQSPRSTKAAKRLLTRLLQRQGMKPKRIITDKLRSFGAARANVMPNVEHRSHKVPNNRGRELACAAVKTGAYDATISISRSPSAFRLDLFRSHESLRPSPLETICSPDPNLSPPGHDAVARCHMRSLDLSDYQAHSGQVPLT